MRPLVQLGERYNEINIILAKTLVSKAVGKLPEIGMKIEMKPGRNPEITMKKENEFNVLRLLTHRWMLLETNPRYSGMVCDCDSLSADSTVGVLIVLLELDEAV